MKFKKTKESRFNSVKGKKLKVVKKINTNIIITTNNSSINYSYLSRIGEWSLGSKRTNVVKNQYNIYIFLKS
jgi:hypothetical protein